MGYANALYYAQKDPFKDFTTSPEIGQVFGELLGAWSAFVWQLMSAPPRVALVEAGPGRGTLLQDALRTIQRVAPDFARAIDVHLIETSPRLRAEQATRVADATWHDDLACVPPGPSIFLANEFLDALPIRQFVRKADGWAERHVLRGGFVEIPSAGPKREALPGSVIEVSEAAENWVSGLARRLAAEGGAALIVDYGSENRVGDSFQALRAGKPADPLVDPGSADLTAHVDFAALGRAAASAGAIVWGPITQGLFLRRLGLWERTAALEAANPGRHMQLRDSAWRLASPDMMGELFKVMCITQPDFPVPPGFGQ